MNSRKIILLVSLWALFAALAVIILFMVVGKPKSHLPTFGPVPSFTLVAQDKRPVSAADFQGKVSIVDFIFTSCQGPCPIMSRTMAGMQSTIPANRNIQFISISVDPENDTPEVLQEYGSRYGADQKRWSFFTGQRSTIEGLSRNAFHLAMVGADSGDIVHSTMFVLVDKNAVIRGYYDSDETEAVSRLVADASELEKE